VTGTIELRKCESPDEWRAITDACRSATVYHSWEWCVAQKHAAAGTEFCPLIATSGGSRYVVPVFRCAGTLCLSWFGYGGIAGPEPESIRFCDLEHGLYERFEEPLYRAMLSPGQFPADVVPGEDGWQSSVTYMISLAADAAAQLKNVRKSARRHVEYGRKRGLVIRDLTAEYWPLIAEYENNLLREKEAGYRVPLEFLLAIEQMFRGKGLQVLGAFVGAQLVGAEVFLHWRQTSYDMLSVITAQGRQYRAGHALLAACLDRGRSCGMKQVDLGPAPTPNLSRIKEDWGGQAECCLEFDVIRRYA
jgi:Acetyltransferase (GNAT) domain